MTNPVKYCFFIFVCTLISTACVKRSPRPSPEINTHSTQLKRGLPDDLNQVNGYLFNRHSFSSSSALAHRMSFARFTLEGRNPLEEYNHYNMQHEGKGNIRPGLVAFNDFHLGFSNLDSAFNFGDSRNYIPDEIIWQIQSGNKDALRITVQDPMPGMTNLPEVMNISKTQQVIFDLSGMITNYDSAIVILAPGNGPTCRKDITKNLSLSFSGDDLFYFQNGLNTLTFYAFRYEHITMNGVLYLLEHSVAKNINVTIIN